MNCSVLARYLYMKDYLMLRPETLNRLKNPPNSRLTPMPVHLCHTLHVSPPSPDWFFYFHCTQPVVGFSASPGALHLHLEGRPSLRDGLCCRQDHYGEGSRSSSEREGF